MSSKARDFDIPRNVLDKMCDRLGGYLDRKKSEKELSLDAREADVARREEKAAATQKQLDDWHYNLKAKEERLKDKEDRLQARESWWHHDYKRQKGPQGKHNPGGKGWR
ncbi:unnamed protein product [Symbiodinium sp. CCMP2592]|nr:unnamed protein product [Symbiodinium sp. CCMP2592]